MKKTTLAIAALAATLAGSAQAQVCASYPTVDGGISLGGRIDFPDDLDSFGVEASYNARGPLAVFGGLNVLSGERDDDESEDLFFAGLAFDTPQLGAMLGPGASACPQLRVEYGDFDGLTFLRVPVGRQRQIAGDSASPIQFSATPERRSGTPLEPTAQPLPWGLGRDLLTRAPAGLR